MKDEEKEQDTKPEEDEEKTEDEEAAETGEIPPEDPIIEVFHRRGKREEGES